MFKFLQKFWPLIILLLISLGAIRFLFAPGYFYIHDDLQVMRLWQMEKCLKDGQIPCRWVPDMGYGFGFPLFNFYPPGPYYLGAFIKLIFSTSLIDTVKILFGLSVILSGIFMYILVRTFWGRLAAILSATLFIYAPYHSVDIFVRGAMNEVWGLTFFPIVFYTLYRLSQRGKLLWLVASSLSLSGLFLSHNIMTLIFTPFAFVWFMFWVLIGKNFKNIFYGFGSFILGAGLSAFFLIPAVLEQPLVQINNLTADYFYFGAHFVSLNQLFLERNWGYGPSEYGDNDDLSFQIGWPHWWLPVVVAVAFMVLNKWSALKATVPLLGFLGGGFLVSLFMSHARSFPVWQAWPVLQFTQFPWRFLSLAVFFNAFLAGALLMLITKRFLKVAIFTILVILTLALNLGYFDFLRHYDDLDDNKKLSGEDLRLQKQAGLLDYLPVTVKTIPQQEASPSANIIEGEAVVRYFDKRSDYFGLGVEVFGKEPAVFQLPIFEFPNWVVVENNREVIDHLSTSDMGLLTVRLSPGNHDVAGWFTNTQIRIIANAISGLSFLIMLGMLILQRR